MILLSSRRVGGASSGERMATYRRSGNGAALVRRSSTVVLPVAQRGNLLRILSMPVADQGCDGCHPDEQPPSRVVGEEQAEAK